MNWLTKLFKGPALWAAAQTLLKLMMQAEATEQPGKMKLLDVLLAVPEKILRGLGVDDAYERLAPLFRAAIEANKALINGIKEERERLGLK